MKISRSCKMYHFYSNYRTTIVSIFLFGMLGIIAGCAPQLTIREISANSPQSAFDQLASLNKSIIKYQADGDIQIGVPNGYYNLQAKVLYQQKDRWLIKINGPFGLRLANIETDGSRYTINLRFSGASFSGYLDEPFTINAIDLELPRLDLFVNLLLPVIDINSKYYNPINEQSSAEDSTLVINYLQKNAGGEVRLKVSYDPLKVYSEERSLGGKYLYKREFEYNSSNSFLPELIKISHDNMSIAISYSNIQYHDKHANSDVQL